MEQSQLLNKSQAPTSDDEVHIFENVKLTGIGKSGRKYGIKPNKETGELEPKSTFFQFYKDNFGAIQELLEKNWLASRIFFFFIENMDYYNNSVIVSYQVLEEIYGFSRPTINRAIKYLKDNKYIDIVKSGNMNVYLVNATLVWQREQNQIKYAKFNAKVIISEKEQTTKKVFKAEIQVKKNKKGE